MLSSLFDLVFVKMSQDLDVFGNTDKGFRIRQMHRLNEHRQLIARHDRQQDRLRIVIMRAFRIVDDRDPALQTLLDPLDHAARLFGHDHHLDFFLLDIDHISHFSADKNRDRRIKHVRPAEKQPGSEHDKNIEDHRDRADRFAGPAADRQTDDIESARRDPVSERETDPGPHDRAPKDRADDRVFDQRRLRNDQHHERCQRNRDDGKDREAVPQCKPSQEEKRQIYQIKCIGDGQIHSKQMLGERRQNLGDPADPA